MHIVFVCSHLVLLQNFCSCESLSRFCFVELSDSGDVEKAVKLSGQELKGSELTIQVAKEGSKADATAADKKQKKSDKDKPKPGNDVFHSSICLLNY